MSLILLLKRYQNAFISLAFIVSSILLFYSRWTGGHFLQTPFFILALVPVLNVLAVFFAFRSKKLNEPQFAWLNLAIIEIITLAFILMNYAIALVVASGCGNGPC